MSKPPVFPQQSASGITVHPRTLERVIPESRRPDGSIRKEIRIRPGFTPQEDITRFRGTRQQAMDATALPKGHILGWVAPSSETQKAKGGASAPPPNKNARKRANQRARKAAEKAEAVKDSWEEDEGETTPASETLDKPKAETTQGEAEITDKLSRLQVK